MTKLEFEDAKKCLETNGYSYESFKQYIIREISDGLTTLCSNRDDVYVENTTYRYQVYQALNGKGLTLEDWRSLSDREVLFLCIEADLSNSQVASIFGISTSAVKWRYDKLGVNKNLMYGRYKITQQDTDAFLRDLQKKFNLS